MSGGIEAAGDIATGALLGRVVEPEAGEHGGAGAHGVCLNCGTALIGEFCHACGQNGHVHKTLWSIGHDLLHGVFHFEGKIWRTLPLLVWHPGDLTRRYIAGERARFVSPLALFLFCVFLTFATFESVGPPFRPTPTVTRNGRVLTRDDLAAEQARARLTVSTLRSDHAAAAAAHRPTGAIDARLEAAEEDLRGLETAQRITSSIDNPQLSKDIKVDTGSRTIDERIRRATANPALLLYRLQASAYKFAWALIPLSLPFVWAMFAWRRQHKPYDHAVFITYSLSAVLLLFVVMALLQGVGIRAGWLQLLIPIHFFRQLREAYALRWFGALWRTAGLMVAAVLSLSAFATLMVVLALD